MYPILIVEDSPDDAKLIQMALKRTGLLNEIVWLMDGETVVNWLRNNTPLLVLLDLKLSGGMDGLDVLRAIRDDRRFSHLGVIIFTSSADQADAIEAYRLGTNVYVRKEPDFRNLMDAIASLRFNWAILPTAHPERGENP